MGLLRRIMNAWAWKEFVVIIWPHSLFFFEVGEHSELGALEKLHPRKCFRRGPFRGSRSKIQGEISLLCSHKWDCWDGFPFLFRGGRVQRARCPRKTALPLCSAANHDRYTIDTRYIYDTYTIHIRCIMLSSYYLYANIIPCCPISFVQMVPPSWYLVHLFYLVGLVRLVGLELLEKIILTTLYSLLCTHSSLLCTHYSILDKWFYLCLWLAVENLKLSSLAVFEVNKVNAFLWMNGVNEFLWEPSSDLLNRLRRE